MPVNINNILPKNKFRIIAFSFTLTVLIVSLWPIPEGMEPPGDTDKYIHAVLYFVLFILWYAAGVAHAGRLALFLAAYGLLVELLQEWVPWERSFDWMDWVFDLVGIAGAWMITALLSKESTATP